MAEDRVLYTLLGRNIPTACPLGHPPGAEDLFDDVDYLMEIPEEPFSHKLQTQRKVNFDALIGGGGPFPAYRKFRPRRRWKDGTVVAFDEVDRQNTGPLDLSRPFDHKKKNETVMGNPGTGIPFFPGGFDMDVKDILPLDTTPESVDWTKLKTDPPGMKGISFQPETVVNLTLENLIKNEIEEETFNWVPNFNLENSTTEDVQLDDGTSINENELIDMLDEPTVIAPVVSDDTVVEVTPIPSPVWMVNADKTVDVSKPWSELLPDPAYKWPFELDLFQKRAILCVEKHESVFVAAHTSAGKTVVAEYAIALSSKHMTRVIYTSPIKALSNQKFRDFRATFTDVGLLTGDCQIKPEAGCLIMTTEILRSMLYAGSDVIRDLEWVIFDEVHYINDAERGVVWEEVLIMLPAHVGLILLSATVPNIEQFASWVGRIKKRQIYVTSTNKRPVPLEHYLFTGNSIKTSNQLFKIIDQDKRFINYGHKAAREAKELNMKKSKKPPSEQAIWTSVIDCLKKRGGLPAVAFTLSRRRCDTNAACLTGIDLTTPSEKNEVGLFYRRCTMKLKPIDRKLPQVVHLAELLERGLAVHHSGILPILKETIELLFARGLVKVLFATETFAMGVNMPARTVLFDSIRKHDGRGMRDLIPSEYIQMAGRAGRRGLDSFGTVVLVQRGFKISDQQDLVNMMLGKAAALVSKFRLTYGMLLSILRVGSLRVEDIMLRSFIEFGRRDQPTQIKMLKAVKDRKDKTTNVEKKIEGTDFEEYVHTAKSICEHRRELCEAIFNGGNSKVFQASRLCLISRVIPAVVISRSGQTATVLYNKPQKMQQPYNKEIIIDGVFEGVDTIDPVLSTIQLDELDGIFKDVIKIRADDVLYEQRKHQVGSATNQAAVTLNRYVQEHPLRQIDFVKDGGLNTIECIEKISSLDSLYQILRSYSAPKLPYFKSELAAVVEMLDVREEYRIASFNLSEESLQHLPDYKSRVSLLRNWNYIGDHGGVQLKGRVACQFRGGNELLLTEMLLSAGLQPLAPAEVCALLSSLVFQSRVDNESDLIERLPEKCQEAIIVLKEIREDVLAKEAEFGILSTDHDSAAPLNFGLSIVVYKWANGESFKDIMSMTDIQEGIIVRAIQRLEELCREVRNGARTVGDFSTTAKMEQCSEAIKRDIVFAASLYTQS